MGEFRYIPPDEVAARHRAARPTAPLRQNGRVNEAPIQRNVQSVLDLGSVRYVTFGNRTYCIPPVPFKLGQRVLDSHTRALSHAKEVVLTGGRGPADEYYKELRKLARMLWTHIRPLGRVKRFLWHLGLTRNPFARASEMEMKAITDFFLQGRMMSSVRSISAMDTRH